MQSTRKTPTKASHDICMLRPMEQTIRRPPIYLNGAYPMVGHRLLTRMPMQRHTPKRKLSLEPTSYSSKRTSLKASPVSRKTPDANVILLSYTSSMKRQLMRSASASVDFKPMLTERNLCSSKRIHQLYESSATTDLIGGLNRSVIRPVAGFDKTPMLRVFEESVDESLVGLIHALEKCT
jgi:hypothetical protein